MSLVEGSGFFASLQQASFRGVPFGVRVDVGQFGRRVADHDYPFRDTPWAEDIGRAGRRFTITGFLIADDLVYGGGDVVAQRDAMVSALEAAGPGTLVHPTLGVMTVSAEPSTITGRWDEGRYFEILFNFVESGQQIFPSTATSTTNAVTTAATAADGAASDDFATAMTPLLPAGAIIAETASLAAAPWGSELAAIGADATSLTNLAAALPGNFGRFFNGANVSALSGFAQLLSPSTTLDDLVADASAARVAIATAVTTVAEVAGDLGLGASSAAPADLAASAQSAVAAALTSIANPADAIRLLADLAEGVPVAGANAAATGLALNDLFRRAAVVALAQASSAYQPQSYDDANAVRGVVAAALDVEIAIAGDEGEDETFNALRALRVAVVQDLTARGATLAPIVRIRLPAPIPALVLAQSLYRDPTRADQLVAEAGVACDNPLFMPSPLRVLAS